jgi:hypothetical protein
MIIILFIPLQLVQLGRFRKHARKREYIKNQEAPKQKLAPKVVREMKPGEIPAVGVQKFVVTFE